MSLDVFHQHFSDIEDHRQSAKVTYLLFDVLFLTVCAVIAGCEGWEEIEDFGIAREDWLKDKGLFENGLPVHDTIARIISGLKPEQLQQCFVNWMQDVSARTNNEVIAIDGKTLRGSYNRKDRQSTIHMVSAFATANGVVLGQQKTEEKSNEITAIPELLELLDIGGCLISIDAMGCQKAIAKKVIEKDADYLLALKGNQETLFNAVKDAFADTLKDTDWKSASVEKGHGRIEVRKSVTMPASELNDAFSAWPSLTTIGVVANYRIDKHNKESLEYRYYISSATLSAEALAKAVRSHWDVENRLHWVLDTSMREDGCQIYRGNAAQNLACVRHIALNMLRSEKTKKASIPRKRRFAVMETSYLDRVLIAGCRAMAKK